MSECLTPSVVATECLASTPTDTEELVAAAPALAFYNEDGTLEISEIDFGLLIGPDTSEVTIRIVNVGTLELYITGLTLDSPDFSIVSGPSLTTIPPGGYALVTILFDPIAA